MLLQCMELDGERMNGIAENGIVHIMWNSMVLQCMEWCCSE
jgi:hypothetical protein